MPVAGDLRPFCLSLVNQKVACALNRLRGIEPPGRRRPKVKMPIVFSGVIAVALARL